MSATTEAVRYAVGMPCVPGMRGYTYHAARLYVATKGRRGWYWKATSTIGPLRRGFGVLREDAERMARQWNCEVLPVTHGSRVV